MKEDRRSFDSQKKRTSSLGLDDDPSKRELSASSLSLVRTEKSPPVTPPRNNRKAQERHVESPTKKENTDVSGFLDKMSMRDWKIRYETIHEVSSYAVMHKEAVVKEKHTGTIFDCFAKGLVDSNMKVNIHSLSALLKIIPLFKKSLEPHVQNLLESISVGMGSANSSIRSMAKDVFDTIIESVDKNTLFNPLINVTPGVNVRAKAAFINTVTL